ncbi:uncharacterized protein BDV17DRAFT_297116 [Aspergillus undulatus]|uniref:uncharacterized protein n=1 Tax=Aspergillus undulatus TaxID=1810928 RepID=UPI003CCE2A88
MKEPKGLGITLRLVNNTFISPVYDSLETNIPNSLMQSCDFPFPQGTALFPAHHVVKEYLHRYAGELSPYIQFQSQVLDVSFMQEKTNPGWAVTWRDLASGNISTAQFDVVLVANGHHNESHLPAIPGLEEWNRMYPKSIIHSSLYRRVQSFTDENVIVVGQSTSGTDIANQVSQVSRQPLLISERTTKPSQTTTGATSPNHHPEITLLDASNKSIHFANGHIEADVDNIIFGTGYHFSVLFFKLPDTPPIVTTGARPHNLYKHVFYTANPTLAFIGTPLRIARFPFSQTQAAGTARVFAVRLGLPSSDETDRWVEWESSALTSGRGVNSLVFPLDADYINELYEISMGAALREGPENGGREKEPPYRGEGGGWTKGRFPAIKKASQVLGRGGRGYEP